MSYGATELLMLHMETCQHNTPTLRTCKVIFCFNTLSASVKPNVSYFYCTATVSSLRFLESASILLTLASFFFETEKRIKLANNSIFFL